LQHQRDVVGRIEERQQVVELEDEADLVEPQRLRLAAASWPSSRRSRRRAPSLPADGSRMQPMTLSSVVLPEPDGPSSATTSPGLNVERDVAQRIDARLALAEMLGDAVEPHQRTVRPAVAISAPECRGRIDLERCAHAETARQQADDEDDEAEDQDVVGLQHHTARESSP
jgi:hypothetical protein